VPCEASSETTRSRFRLAEHTHSRARTTRPHWWVSRSASLKVGAPLSDSASQEHRVRRQSRDAWGLAALQHRATSACPFDGPLPFMLSSQAHAAAYPKGSAPSSSRDPGVAEGNRLGIEGESPAGSPRWTGAVKCRCTDLQGNCGAQHRDLVAHASNYRRESDDRPAAPPCRFRSGDPCPRPRAPRSSHYRFPLLRFTAPRSPRAERTTRAMLLTAKARPAAWCSTRCLSSG
jgi:hypothetical protein